MVGKRTPDLSTSGRRKSASLIGRFAEKKLLAEELALAIAGHGRLVLLAGEAGIGKSTVARHLAADAEAAGAVAVVGHCYEGSVQPAFAPWQALLTSLPDAPAAAPLPAPFGAGPPSKTGHELMARVAAHLVAVASERPLVLLLEDLHWADRDSLDLLDVMTRSVAQSPILVLATYRQDAVHRELPLFHILPMLQRDRPIRNLALSALTVDDVSLLVEQPHGACSPALAEYLHSRSEGHPLFVVELARDLIERHLLPRDEDGRWLPPTHAVDVPALLQHLIAHRVARLGTEVATLLAVAAIVGEEWNLGVVEAVLEWEEEPLLRALEAGLRADIIVPSGEGERYRFRHGLIREVLYGEQLARRRKRLHHRVADILEAEIPEQYGGDAALAYHFGAAEEWEKAVRYGIAAGDAARKRFASHSALAAYQQALAALAHTPVDAEPRIGLYERLGQTHLVVGQAAAADSAFQKMLEAARASGNPAGEARAVVWLSYSQRRQYQRSASTATGESGLRMAEELEETRLLALAHWNVGHLFYIEGDLDQGQHHGVESERLARLAGVSDILSRALQLQSMLAIWHGRYLDGAKLAGEALGLAHDGQDWFAVAGAHWRLGLALGETGQYAAALRTLLEGVSRADALGERYYLAKLTNTVGWLYHEIGDPETARVWNARALATVRSSAGEAVTEAERYTLLNLATDALASGNIDEAAEHLRTVEPLLQQHDYGRFRYTNRYQLLQAELALAQGDAAAALVVANEAPRLALEKDMPKNLAKSRFLAGRALLMLGRPRDAIDALTEGVGLADGIGHGSLRWQGRLWLGDALRTLRRDARDVYREAMELVERLARDLDDGQLRATFLAAPRVEALRTAYAAAEAERPAERPAGLTARELDVLRLLARHQTDKEIAEALFLSPRTVSTHVASIFVKLNVTNRREAAAAAAGLGLD